MPRGKSIYPLATRADFEPVLHEVESALSLKYVVDEWRVKPDFPVYRSALEIPGFGIAQYASGQNMQLLVVPEDAELVWDYLPTRQVPEKYGFLGGQVDNPRSVIFDPSSYYAGEGGPALLWGWIATISDDPDSLAIFKAFKKAIRKRFVYVDECYLGPEAQQMLIDGIRLTQSAGAPREQDIPRLSELEAVLARKRRA